jgi:hypothetical protein
LYCQVACNDLEKSFYNITSVTQTGNYKEDVKQWILSDDFPDFILKQDSTFKILIPILDLDSQIIIDKNNLNTIPFIIDYLKDLDGRYFNNGFANFLVSQISNTATLKKWKHCKKYEYGLDIFVYDTIVDIFHLHLSSQTSSGNGIKIEKPLLINAIYDSLKFKNGIEIYSGGQAGYFEIFCRKQNVLKPTFIFINSTENFKGIFIYLPPSYVDQYSSNIYLNGDFYLMKSSQNLIDCGLKFLIQNEGELTRTDTNFVLTTQNMDDWAPEQIDCFRISNYLYQKGILLNIIKGIANNKDSFVRNTLPAYKRTLNNIESKFFKPTYIVNPLWKRTFPNKAESY